MKILSIVIVNYNVKRLLEQLLYSLSAAIKNLNAEVIVVDNCSSDGSVEYLRPLFPWVTFVENRENVGFSRANNQAIKMSDSRYVLLLNPDTVVGETVLTDVVAFMDRTPDAGAVGVKMIDGTGRFLPESKRGFPTPWVSFCKMVGLNALFPYSTLFGRYHLRYLDSNRIHRVEVLAGAFMMLRREALQKSGLLDERFFMYGEDIDLSYRITQSGYENYYLPFPILHYKGESTQTESFRYVRVFYHAMYLFFQKHYPHYGRLYWLFVVLGIVVSGTAAALRRTVTAPLRLLSRGKNRPFDRVISTSDCSYAEIIRQIEASCITHTRIGIYTSASGQTL